MEPQSPNDHQMLPIKTSIYQIMKKKHNLYIQWQYINEISFR
jgi:hypothetical protein